MSPPFCRGQLWLRSVPIHVATPVPFSFPPHASSVLTLACPPHCGGNTDLSFGSLPPHTPPGTGCIGPPPLTSGSCGLTRSSLLPTGVEEGVPGQAGSPGHPGLIPLVSEKVYGDPTPEQGLHDSRWVAFGSQEVTSREATKTPCEQGLCFAHF